MLAAAVEAIIIIMTSSHSVAYQSAHFTDMKTGWFS